MEVYEEQAFITPATDASEQEYRDFMTNNVKKIKNMKITIEAIRAEEKALKARREAVEERLERAKEWIGIHLGVGNQFTCAVGSLGWGKSKAVKITGEVPEQYRQYQKGFTINKEAIGDDLRAGATLTFAEFETRDNLQVK